MKDEELKQIIYVSKLYYEHKMSQEQIAKKISVSRPTVSRMLKTAIDNGYVKTIVIDPFENIQNLEREMINKFKLKHVKIVSTVDTDKRYVKSIVGKAAADYLVKILKPNDILGVSWGTTLYEVARHIEDTVVDELKIVQMNGFIYENTYNDYVFGVIKMLGTKLHGTTHYLYAQGLTSSIYVRNALLDDRNIRNVLEMSKNSSIAIFGIGYPERTSMVVKYGYLNNEDLERLYQNGVKGDICSRFYDIEGKIIDKELDDRTISIPLHELRNKEYSIAVACGANKVSGIIGAICGGYLNVLITDEDTAREILKQS